MASSTKVHALQTLIDIAMQQCGQADSLFDVAKANGMGITDDLQAGQTALAPDVVNTDVADFFRKYNIIPASGNNSVASALPGGIDYMAVELDFIIA